MPRSTPFVTVLAVVMLIATLSPAAAVAEDEAATDGPVHASLPEDAVAITQAEPYHAARWIYYVVDPATGEELYAAYADQFMPTASIAKEFTVGAVYDRIGADVTITTPVVATVDPVDGVIDGDLVLIAQGDLGLGGRNAAGGRFDFTADGVDHVYADAIPGARLLEGNDPLAGLDDLAGQIAAAGVTEVTGNALIDDRLWELFDADEGPVPPIFVNDNLVDILLTPGEPGEPAAAAMVPQTAAYDVVADVTTGEADGFADVDVDADPADPRTLRVTGTVPAGDPSLTVYRIPDAASWARTLFIEALARAGVTVGAGADGGNDAGSLPPEYELAASSVVAAIESAPLSEMGGMILATSYNTGANTFLCLLAVHLGSKDCQDGLAAIREMATDAGIPASELMLVDGQGGYPATATPRAISQWLGYMQAQPWGQLVEDGLPSLGERGSLVMSGVDSPAAGKVKGKTGTDAVVEPGTGRLFVGFQGLAGYLDVGTEQSLIFVVGVKDALFPGVAGIFTVNDDVADVAAAIQQAEAAAR